MMKKTTLGLALAAFTLASGAAFAAGHAGPGPGADPFGDQTIGRDQAQAHAGEMFAKMDVNKDGKLDQADRAAHRGAKFDQADANKDGAISRDEFAGAQQKHGKMGREGGGGHGMAGKMIMRMADANNDQAVSRDEFLATHLKHFEKADADKDGKLSAAERKAAHAKMREHMKGMRGGHGQPPAPGAQPDPHAGH